MRHTTATPTFLLLAVFSLGGISAEGKAALGPNDRETTAELHDKANTEAKEAARAMEDYRYAQKAEFVDKMKRALIRDQEELDRLSNKVGRSAGAARADARTKLQAVRAKWAEATRQLDHAEGATESNWQDMRGGFKKAYGDLKDSFDRTRQWISDKIEP